MPARISANTQGPTLPIPQTTISSARARIFPIRFAKSPHAQRRLAEDNAGVVFERTLVEVERLDLSGFDVEAVDVLEGRAHDRRRDPERAVEGAHHLVVTRQAEEAQGERADAPDLVQFAV